MTVPREAQVLPRPRERQPLRVHVVTLFPELFLSWSQLGMVGRALEQGAFELRLWHLRAFGAGRHRSVDDTPYGGGSGMVLRPDVVVNCLDAIDAAVGVTRPAPGAIRGVAPLRLLLTPQGAPFRQATAARLALEQELVLVCGRYEGFDERVRAWVNEELSLGDFVLTGGEPAAMAILDATVRLLPAVLGNDASATEESHSPACGGLLEYPHYTRPVEFRGQRVPQVLQDGNHARIRAWREQEALVRTRQRRPDLLPHSRCEAAEDGDPSSAAATSKVGPGTMGALKGHRS